MDQKELPRIAGKLRSKYLEMPEEIYRAKGIVIMGKRIKSVIFTTDIAIIRSCNADAVLAVYPFTPQQVISQSIINVAPMPVFVGVGGGITMRAFGDHRQGRRGRRRMGRGRQRAGDQ